MAYQHPDEFEPEWTQGAFSGMLRCDNKACQDWVAIGGSYAVEAGDDWNVYVNALTVKFAHPPLPFFAVPTKTPAKVASSVKAAANVIWSEPDSAATKLREAVERILDDRRIRKFNQNKEGKRLRSPRSLSVRIADLKTQSKYAQVADLFDALRLRGNIGTHGSGLDADAVLDMAAVLELALRLLYDKSDAATVKMAKEMVTRKGKP